MADTLLDRLNKTFGNNTIPSTSMQFSKSTHKYANLGADDIIFSTNNKEEYEKKLLSLKQERLLAKQWKKATYELQNNELANQTEVQMMYREADMMDLFPEIGAALDIYSEEVCVTSNDSKMIKVTSKSERIKSILEDLIYNRLSCNTLFPMITRSTVKYGNTFMLLNITEDNGIIGWTLLPVYEMQRFENGMDNPYSAGFTNIANIDVDKNEQTKFVWVGKNEYTPYRNFQIAHFRLLYDSLYLPYGCSNLNKARRHWRMLSMMEDMMLMYRLERSVERRVFKVNVGDIDNEDVPAFIDDIANNFKRTPTIDPKTGQIDLRKNVLGQMEDYFFPVRDPSEPSPIETLPAAQNLTAMDDIKYVQGKLCAALRVPLPFLNFNETQGDGKNLSMLDVRFSRTVNRIQQMMLMELNKVCIIHLYLLGFEDELTNFQLTMNNPSSQSELMNLENLSKKIEMAKSAVADPGGGLPLMSLTRAQKEIMGWSEKEIADNLEELRLEKALSAELEQTAAIIKKTGLFDRVDNIYGEPGAEYGDAANGQGQENGGTPGGGGMGLPPLGGGLSDDFSGDMSMDMPEGSESEGEGEIPGEEGDMSMNDAAEMETAEPLNEMFYKKLMEKTILERKKMYESRAEYYKDRLIEHRNRRLNESVDSNKIPLYRNTFLVNADLNSMAESLGKILSSDNNLTD